MNHRRMMSAALLLLVTGCDRAVTSSLNPDLRPPTRAFGAFSPDDSAVLASIAAQIQALVSGGSLNNGQGTSLIAKLNAAQAQIAAGNSAAVKGMLGAFINQVGALSKAGNLTPAIATSLTTLVATVGGNSRIYSQLATGDGHTCGLATGGYAYCWGANQVGQLGNGTNIESSVPVLVSATETFSWIGAGSSHTCALTTAGQPMCWGGGQVGQLGNGGVTDRNTPGLVAGSQVFVSMSTGSYASCGTTAGGVSLCWGPGGRLGVDFGGLATAPSSACVGYFAGTWPCNLAPAPMTGGQVLAFTSETLHHGCGLTATSQAYCWGWGQFGENGNGLTTNALTPVAVSGGIAFAFLDGGATHTCGRDAGGAAYCWGAIFFNNGQLGNGAFIGSTTPVAVLGGLTFKTIRPSKGNDIWTHTCAVASNDSAYCWGSNNVGQLGAVGGEVCTILPDDCATTPRLVTGGLAWQDLATGAETTCGLTTIGEAYCWGRNSSGQLGDGTTTDRSVPTLVLR